MRVCLIDVDSKIPNLALMKLSAHHKKKGDEVGLNLSDPDLVYASIVFTENHWKADEILKQYDGVEVHIGGSGYNYSVLPGEIEHLMPDYSLYGIDYSIGYTTRGCIRHCPFCIVRDKEGMLRPNCDIYEFWDRTHKHLLLLDNNVLAEKKHFARIASQILKHNLSVDFNQGMDIRLVNDENAEILSKLNVKPKYRFAWDNVRDEQLIKTGLDLLKKHGVKSSFFYVLVGFDTTKEEDMYRVLKLKEWGQRPYVMRYETCRGVRWYNDFAGWVNQKHLFKTLTFDEFVVKRHTRKRDRK